MTKHANILIAHSDKQFATGAARILRAEGYSCDTVPCLRRPTVGASFHMYDLLVCRAEDVTDSGVDEAAHIGTLGGMPPAIIIADSETCRMPWWVLELPVTAWLCRPVSMAEVLSRVRIALDCCRVQAAVAENNRRLDEWQSELDDLQQAIHNCTAAVGPVAVHAFLSLMTRNIVSSILQLVRMVEEAEHMRSAPTACNLLACPRLDALDHSLHEAIDVLEQTKSSFKSKELGALRRRLEACVHQMHSDTSGSGRDALADETAERPLPARSA